MEFGACIWSMEQWRAFRERSFLVLLNHLLLDYARYLYTNTIHRTQLLHCNKSLKRVSLRYIVTTNFRCNDIWWRCIVLPDWYFGEISQRLYRYLAYLLFYRSPIRAIYCWYIILRTKRSIQWLSFALLLHSTVCCIPRTPLHLTVWLLVLIFSFSVNRVETDSF